MSKIKIEIVKAQLGLKKGLKTEVDSLHAISLIDRGIAKFQNKADETEYHKRKAVNAKAANDAMKSDAKKAKVRNKGDNERAEKLAEEEKSTKERIQKMTLGRRKNLLKPFAEFIDLDSEEFKLTFNTTKEEFHAMQQGASQAQLDDAQKAEDLFETRTEELVQYSTLIDVSGLTIDSTEEEYLQLLSEGVFKLATVHLFNERTEHLVQFAELIDVTVFTDESTEEEYIALLNEAEEANKPVKVEDTKSAAKTAKKSTPKGGKGSKRR